MRYRMLPVPCSVGGYTMSTDRDTRLLVAYAAEGEVAGGVSLKQLLVLPHHRGRGLGAEIVIRAFESGVIHPETMNVANPLTAAGYANRIAAHRIAVERAVKSGVEVDPSILADYSDLVPIWSTGATDGRVAPSRG
jgi:GNAT superfamily N-acetyltransferase